MRLRLPLIVLCSALILSACTSEAGPVLESTNTSSAAFDTAQARIDFLNTYVMLPSEVIDSHYSIFYQDNSSGRSPGPSDWNMQVVVHVDPTDIASWTDGYEEVDRLESEWISEIAPDWIPTGSAQHFERVGSTVTVWGEAGIVAKRIFTS